MKARFTTAPDAAARLPGLRFDVRYMTRSQIFKSARQLSIGVLIVALAGAIGVAASDARGARSAATFFETFSLLSTVVAGLGAIGAGSLAVCGLYRDRAYDPVSVWRADLQRRQALRRRVRSAIELKESGVRSVRTRGKDLVLEMETYVHESTGRPGHDPGTGWYFPASVRIRSARTRGPLPQLPAAITSGALNVGARQFADLVPAPLERRGLVRVEFELTDGDILVVEGGGVSVALRGAGQFIENRES